MLDRFKLTTRMMFLGVAGVAIFSMVLIWTYFRFEAGFRTDEEKTLRSVTETAFALLGDYDARVRSGELTLQEAQKRAALRVKNLRYSGEEYFWINDTAPNMIMHPMKPELDGKAIGDIKDPNGKYLFQEFVKVCNEKGSGFVDYMWPKPGETKPVPKLSYVKLFKPWGWIIGSGVYIDRMHNDLAGVRNGFLAIFAALLLFGLGGTYWTARSTANPISHAITGLSSSSGQVAMAASQVSSASQQLAEGASAQAAAIEETSSSLEEMASMTKKTAENATQADKLMKETSQIVGRANDTMANLTTSMQEITKASEETQKIIRTIDEIAFQTNLLALNAAVEAARAGESGAGFAVVADEVRNLAMRAAESAKNTATMIEGTVRRIKTGSDLVEETNREFSNMSGMVVKSSGLVGEIAAAATEQAQGIEHLNKAVSEMDKVVQQNAATAEETASVSQEMNKQTGSLDSFVRGLMNIVGASAQANEAHQPSYNGRNGTRVEVKAIARPAGKSKVKEITVARRQTKELPPHQVMSLEDESFKDF
jgi:methyl-accepting chemotaxis protein